MVTFTGPGLEGNCIGLMAYLRPTGHEEEVRECESNRRRQMGMRGWNRCRSYTCDACVSDRYDVRNKPHLSDCCVHGTPSQLKNKQRTQGGEQG